MLPSDRTKLSGGANSLDPKSNQTNNGQLSNGESVPFMSEKKPLQSLNVANEQVSASVSDKPISDISNLTYSNNSKPLPTPAPKKFRIGKTVALAGLGVMLLGGISFGAMSMVNSSKQKTSSLAAASASKTITLNVPTQSNQTNLLASQAGTQTISLNGNTAIQGSLNTSGSLSSTGNMSTSGNLNVQGNIYSGGSLVANSLSGNGNGLTGLNASNLTTGTINSALLPSNVTQLGQTIPLSAIQANVLSSINGITNNGGDIKIVGNGIDVANNSTTKTVTLSLPAGTGTITGVAVGAGLVGGGTSGNVSVALDGTVTVQGNLINVAGGLVKLDGSGNLPVLNGSNLTNLDASNLTTGTIDNSRLNSSVTTQGNTFNGNNQLVQTNSIGELPVISGANLTNLNGSNLQTASVPDSALSSNVCLGDINNCNYQTAGNYQAAGSYINLQDSIPGNVQIGNINISGTNVAAYFKGDGNQLSNISASNITTGKISNQQLNTDLISTSGKFVTLQGNAFNNANELVALDGNSKLPIADGSNLTNLTSTNLIGVINDSNLSSNVVLQNANNVFTSNNTFNGGITSVGNILANDLHASTGTLTIGSSTNPLTLQGSSLSIKQTTGASPVTYTFAGGVAGQSYEICTTLGNCGTGASTIVGSGTSNKLVKFTGNQSIGDSSISDTGSLVTLGSNTLVKPTSNSTATFIIQNASSNPLFTADTSNMFIGVGNSSPQFPLDVTGIINSSTELDVAGSKVCDASGCKATSGSGGFYVSNQATPQAGGGNFNIQSKYTNKAVGVLQGAAGQTADLLDLQNASGTNVVALSNSGDVNIAGAYNINGNNINTAGTLSNVAYLNSSNNFKTDSTSAFQIQNAAGTNKLFSADTTNNKVSIGLFNSNPSLDSPANLVVNGDINITGSTGAFKINGTPLCGLPSGALCAPAANSDAYIQNSTGLLPDGRGQVANINIQSKSSLSIGALIQGATGQVANILAIKSDSNNIVAGFNNSGGLSLGAPSLVQGQLTLNSSSSPNSVNLQATPGSSNATLYLPAEDGGTICTSLGSSLCYATYAANNGSSANYIKLQGSPTTRQTGNLDISGTATANGGIYSIGTIQGGTVN
ncbi:MAG: hypothetical protein WCG30_02740, partial [Candidatus Saccharibacteria bacterium]